jgi:hypothetical protein
MPATTLSRLRLPEPISIVDPENARSRPIAVRIRMADGGQVFNPVRGLATRPQHTARRTSGVRPCR